MSDLPPRPAFWPYLPGYALLLLSVLLCASGSYRFVTPMALADGVDLVYLSQGLALLPLGTGLVGLLAGFLLHVRGRWLGALLALLPAALICAWNLYNYAAHGDEALSPSFAQYTQALLGLLLLGGMLSLVDLLHGRPSTLLRKGLLGLGWLALVAWLGLLFYLQRLYGLTFELVVGFQRAQRIDIGGAGIQGDGGSQGLGDFRLAGAGLQRGLGVHADATVATGGNGHGDGDQFAGLGIQGALGAGFLQRAIGGEHLRVLLAQGTEGFFYGGDELGPVVQHGDILRCFRAGSGASGYQSRPVWTAPPAHASLLST